MSFRELFPAASWIWRTLTGRAARIVYVTVALMLLITSIGVRVYTYALTRRMEAVIAGLGKLEIDNTNEEELVRTVPYLVRWQWEAQLKWTPETGDIDLGKQSGYGVTISNESTWLKFGELIEPIARCCVNVSLTKYGYERGWIFTLTEWVGFRYVYFDASVVLLDRKVSRISYGVADRLGFPRPVVQLVSVKSAHSFWTSHQRGWAVRSTDDESPQFRVNGTEHGIGVSYAYDAPPDLKAHAFQIDLNCFWSLRGCRHVRQIAPLLWKDKLAIEAATLARLQSSDPCPDRVLAGRARYLPDLSLVLLESTGFKSETVNEDGVSVYEIWTNYRLVEVLRGRPSTFWERVRGGHTIPFPGDYERTLPSTDSPWTNAGGQVLAFSNHRFDSCRMVAAKPGALSAVRNTTLATRRGEDQLLVGGLQ